MLFFTILQTSELTLAVPVTNAGSFVITAIVSLIIGEQSPTRKSYLGLALIIAGTTVCMLDKAYEPILIP